MRLWCAERFTVTICFVRARELEERCTQLMQPTHINAHPGNQRDAEKEHRESRMLSCVHSFLLNKISEIFHHVRPAKA